MLPGIERKSPTLEFEQALWESHLERIGGIDEAGRGAWAGPVSAAIVILPVDPLLTQKLLGVRDSKEMSPSARAAWEPRIKACALAWGVDFASPEEIDTIGILAATRLAATRALADLSPDYLLTDYLVFREISLPQTALVKGDQRSLSIAAASVLAKTARDDVMRQLDRIYPGYGFERHKGYGTHQHQEAIGRLGLCEIHRKSFAIMGSPHPGDFEHRVRQPS